MMKKTLEEKRGEMVKGKEGKGGKKNLLKFVKKEREYQ
jgi:hypothetical protein